jgi:hypothetical protein
VNLDTLIGVIHNWISSEAGRPQVFTLTFNKDFNAANTINGSFNGTAISPVAYATSHDNTLLLLAKAIQKTSAILRAQVTGARQITCTGSTRAAITVVGPTVTGGVSPATVTKAVTQSPLYVESIYADQNAPRPDYPYACFKFDSMHRYGEDSAVPLDDQGLWNVGGQRRMTLMVDYFTRLPKDGETTDLGPKSLQAIKELSDSLSKESVLSVLRASGIAIFGKMDGNDVSSMLETVWEDHSQFDVFLGFAENLTDDRGYIGTVILNGTINGTKQVTQTITG